MAKPDQAQALTAVATSRLTIVVRPALQPTANLIAQVAEPTSVGETFRIPLRAIGDATNTPVAYWVNWALTDDQRQRLLTEFGKQFLTTLTPLVWNAQPDLTASFWLFELDLVAGYGYNNERVLTALRMEECVWES